MVVCVHAYLCHPVICSGKRLQVMVEVVMRLCSLQTRTYLSRFSFKHSKTVSSAVLIALMTDGQNMQTAYATYVGAVDRMSGHMNRQWWGLNVMTHEWNLTEWLQKVRPYIQIGSLSEKSLIHKVGSLSEKSLIHKVWPLMISLCFYDVTRSPVLHGALVADF